MGAGIWVFEPGAAPSEVPQLSPQTIDGLAGKVIGFIDNAKPNFNNLVDDLAEVMVTRYGAAAVIKRRKQSAAIPAPDAVMRELIEQCDVVVTGSGD